MPRGSAPRLRPKTFLGTRSPRPIRRRAVYHSFGATCSWLGKRCCRTAGQTAQQWLPTRTSVSRHPRRRLRSRHWPADEEKGNPGARLALALRFVSCTTRDAAGEARASLSSEAQEWRLARRRQARAPRNALRAQRTRASPLGRRTSVPGSRLGGNGRKQHNRTHCKSSSGEAALL